MEDFLRIKPNEWKPGKLALLLASSTEAEELLLKDLVVEHTPFYRLAVTKIGGMSVDIKKKIIPAVVGAALNCKIINKTPGELHSLIHATQEALESFLCPIHLDASLALKIALVGDGDWLCVAVYGDSAIYPLTNHERVGMGTMHLAKRKRREDDTVEENNNFLQVDTNL